MAYKYIFIVHTVYIFIYYCIDELVNVLIMVIIFVFCVFISEELLIISLIYNFVELNKSYEQNNIRIL